MLSTHTEGNDCSDGSKAYMQYLGYLILMSSFVIIFFFIDKIPCLIHFAPWTQIFLNQQKIIVKPYLCPIC